MYIVALLSNTSSVILTRIYRKLYTGCFRVVVTKA